MKRDGNLIVMEAKHMTRTQENKQLIRTHLRENFDDSGLLRLLDHARNGKLSYLSCCCLKGACTADHKDGQLRGMTVNYYVAHYKKANNIPSAAAAAPAYMEIREGNIKEEKLEQRDERGRRILIPMILAEIRRRNPTAYLPEYRSYCDCRECVCVAETDPFETFREELR